MAGLRRVGIIACLILAIDPRTVTADGIAHAIHLIYVEPTGAIFTPAEQAAARSGIAGAVAFWQDLAPTPVPLMIADERMITATGDIYQSLEWSRPDWGTPPALTIFVIDGSTPLLGDSLAQSQTPLGLVWALRGDGDTFAATMAHELGHVVYGLPHQYQASNDVMGLDPLTAYQRRSIGCASLAELGRPCARIYLPLVSS